MTAWSTYSACSVTCGSGTQTRTRSCTGTCGSCPTGALSESIACSGGTGGCPVNCVSSWNAWGSCSVSCGGGTQTRTLDITTQPASGGSACPNPQVQDQECNTNRCPVNCVSSWSAWGSCSVSCGGGSQERTLSVLTYPAYEGVACPTGPTSQSCNIGMFLT